MKFGRSEYQKEIEFLKSEIDTLNTRLRDTRHPEIHWWAKHNAEVIIRLSDAGEILTASPSIKALLGFNAQDVAGKSLDFLFHSLDLPLLRKVIETSLIDTEAEQVCHVRGRNQGMDWVWLEVTVINQCGNPEIMAIMLVMRVLKIARSAHGQGSLPVIQYHDLFKAISDGLLINVIRGDNTYGQFIEANEVACRMLGYSRDELLELSPSDIDAGPEKINVPELVRRMLTGETVIVESTHRKKDGSEFPVEIQTSLFRFEGQVAMIRQVRDITRRKEDEKARKEAEEYLQKIVQNTLDVIWFTDMNLIFRYFSPSVKKSLGYTPEELIGQHFSTILTGEGAMQARQGLESMIERIHSGTFKDPDRARLVEFKGKTRNGTEIWIENSVSVLIDPDGTFRGFIGVSRDTTERKQAEILLHQSEEKLRAITTTAQDAIIAINEEGRIAFWNLSAERIFGYPKEEAIGQKVHELLAPPEFHEHARTQVGVFINTGFGNAIGKTIELRGVRKNGEQFPIELSLSLMKFQGANHAIGILRDITERKRIEEEQRKYDAILAENEERYRTLFNNMAQGVVYQDSRGHIFLANPAAERILGLSLDQMTGRTSTDPRWKSIKEDGSEFAGDEHPAMISLRTGKESSAIMGILKPESGKYTWISITSKPKFNPGEVHPCQVFTTFEDITQIKENLAELKLSNERLEVLRNIDHAIMRSGMHEDTVDELAMQSIMRMIPCEEIQLVVFDYKNDEAVIESRMSQGRFEGKTGLKLPMDLFDFPSLLKGLTYFRNLRSSTGNSKAEEVMIESGFKSVIGVPLMDNEWLAGVFILLSARANFFTAEHVQIAEDIAGQMTLNLNQRDLRHKLQQYTSDLENQVEMRTRELTAILNAVPDLLFRLDRKGTLLDSRSGDPGKLLASPDQFLGKNIDDILPPKVASAARVAMEKAFDTNEVISFEYELELNGEISYFEDRVVVISDNEALSIIRDISERKNAEKALKWNESLLQKMTSSSPLAFFVVDNRNDAILYFNHQFCEIWGINHLEDRMKKGELRNNDIIPDCLPVLKDIPSFAASCAPLQDEHNDIVVEDEIPFNDGRIIRRFSAHIKGENNEYQGRLYIFEDITLRKSTEQFIRIQRDLAAKHSTISTMEEATSIAMDAMLEIEGVDCGGIYLHDPDNSSLNLVVSRGLSQEFLVKKSHYDAETFQAELVKQGKSKYVEYPDLKDSLLQDEINDGLISLAVLPVHYEGQVIGCINLGSKTMPAFYDKIRLPLESLAMQIGGTISRILAEILFQRSQQNFKELFDTLDDFMFILDAKGMIIRTNTVVKQRLGYSDEELQTMHVLQVHPPERRDEAGFIVGEMLAGRALFCPVPLIAKDGTHIPVETRVVLGKWEGKDVLFGISRDITERLKAEKELQVRESYLSAVISNHPGMFWLKDLNGKFLLMNNRNDAFISGLKNKKLENVIGLTDFDITEFEVAESYKKEDDEVIRTRQPMIKEEQTILDNYESWYEKFKFPVVDKNGNVIGISAYSIDITERKKNETALKMQSAAFESFALPIIITNPEGVITWANTSFLKLSGYAMEEVLNETPAKLVKSGEQKKEFYAEMWGTIKSGKVWSGELINRRKDGSLYPEEETITPVFDLNNNISSYIAIKIDLTEKKIMERALRESEARWNFALEGSGDGVWDWNVETDVVFFSNQWKKMLGYSPEEIGNSLREWDQRVHKDDLENCITELNRHFQQETEVYSNEHRMLCKDGNYKWILDRGKVVSWSSENKPRRMIGTHTDISERKKYETILFESIEREKELSKMKSKFISVASHEFRTPLATILATSESLYSYRHRMSEQQLNERIVKIKVQVENLNRIIEEVLSLSRLQAKERELEPELFDFAEITLEIVEEFRGQLGKDQAIEFDSSPEDIEVMLDKKNIQLIISNLISNAVKYSLSGKSVKVGVRATNEDVTLTVKDQGIGIPEDDIKHLFTPFFRASNSVNVPGTGLGLNIVKEAIHRHGGLVTLKSKVDEGTLFTVVLPRTLKLYKTA